MCHLKVFSFRPVEEERNQVTNSQSVVEPFLTRILSLRFFPISGAIEQPTQLLQSALFLLLLNNLPPSKLEKQHSFTSPCTSVFIPRQIPSNGLRLMILFLTMLFSWSYSNVCHLAPTEQLLVSLCCTTPRLSPLPVLQDVLATTAPQPSEGIFCTISFLPIRPAGEMSLLWRYVLPLQSLSTSSITSITVTA